jgi:hypothetical protein
LPSSPSCAAGHRCKIPVAAIVNELISARLALGNAVTEQERIATQVQIAALEARRDVLLAEAGNGKNALMRFLLALGPMLYLNKIFIWDKVLGCGSTDPLSADLWHVALMVVAFYFLADVAAVFRR